MSEKKNLFVYSGDDVDVVWDRRLCIHIGECGRAEGELFVGGRKPWCQPDVTDKENVAEVVERCPTGALFLKTDDEGLQETGVGENAVFVSNNGPYYVRGDLEIAGAEEDQPGLKHRAALCRCGQSKNKPFCDNSHEGDGFIDRGAVGQTGSDEELPEGTLQISRAPNGPLLLNGPCTIVTSSGRAAWTGTKTALCRCGQSKNKPFCDGAHKAAGFEAD